MCYLGGKELRDHYDDTEGLAVLGNKYEGGGGAFDGSCWCCVVG